MAFKVFVDANILLDLTLKRAGYGSARALFTSAISGDTQLYTTPAVLHIVSYYTGQFYSRMQTKEIILALLADVRIIDADHDTALTAANSSFPDLEDALQYYAALREGLQYFLSGDKKLKKVALKQLPVVAPAEFLKLLSN